MFTAGPLVFLILLIVAAVVVIRYRWYTEAIIALVVLAGLVSGWFGVDKLRDHSDANDIAAALLLLVCVVALIAAAVGVKKLCRQVTGSEQGAEGDAVNRAP